MVTRPDGVRRASRLDLPRLDRPTLHTVSHADVVPSWKGRLAIACRKALNELLVGVDQERDFLPRLSREAQRHHTEPLIATAWYAEREASEIVEAAAAVLGRPVYDVAHDVGRRSMMHQYGGLGMAVASVLVTPRLVVRYAGANWSKFRNNGALHAELREPGHIVNVLRGWQGHSPALCRGTWGAIEGIWANMRWVRNTSVRRSACVSLGAPECSFEVRYDS